MKVSQLQLRYLHRALAASGDTPTVYTASGGTVRTVASASLTEANDYWNGAIVRWDSGANAGLYSNVADFDAATDTIMLDDVLPNEAAAGDTFTLLLGGKHASSQLVPVLATSALQNVTGFAITGAAGLNDEGTGTLRFNTDAGLSWQPPGEVEGDAVAVSGLALGDTVTLTGGGTSTQQRSKFLVLTRTAAALPVADAADDVSLDVVLGGLLARVTGAEAAAGVTIYRPVAIRNAATEAAYDLLVYVAPPFPAASETTLAAGIGTGDDVLEAANLAGWGAQGWVWNRTKDDARFYRDRSGNSAAIVDPAGGARGFTAVAWDVDDELVALPWCDVGLDAPGGGNVFEDPATRAAAPSGVAFSCPLSAADGLSIGDLAAGALHCIWLRFEFPAGVRPLEGGLVDVRVAARVTE